MTRNSFLALFALLAFGCVTSEDGGSADVYRLNGVYQSTDNELLFTMDYPNWTAHYYARTPSLYVSGVVDSISIDTTRLGPDWIDVDTKAHFRVTDFYQASSDGARIPADSAMIVAAKFSSIDGELITAATFDYERTKDGNVYDDTTFTFTGHKLR